jgi:carbon monoxide dehydrogenase subunit G
MKLENSFVVPGSPDEVWDFMLDVERVVPCMPGAELTETVDERTWKGKVGVRLGPVSLSFTGTVVREETDEAERRVVLKAQGSEARGKGMASATVTSRLEPAEGGTRVDLVTDLSLSGAVAQYGRGLIADVSRRFTDEFAECLAGQLGRSKVAGEAGAAAAPAARPVSGLRLGLWVLFRAAGRLVARVLPFGGSRSAE